jgi:hypothetical protein
VIGFSGTARWAGMFAQSSVTISESPERVAGVLTEPGHSWTVGLDGDGRSYLTRVGIRIGRLPIYKHVQLTLGKPLSTAPTDRLMLPVSWEAVGGPPLFPRMEGTLHVQPAQGGGTLLTLNANYDPPLGRIGALIDRAAMHRLAGATMQDFVRRTAALVMEQLNPA